MAFGRASVSPGGAGEGSEENRGWASPWLCARGGRGARVARVACLPRCLGGWPGRTRRSRGRGSSARWLRCVPRALPSACAGDRPRAALTLGVRPLLASLVTLAGPPSPSLGRLACTVGVVHRVGFGSSECEDAASARQTAVSLSLEPLRARFSCRVAPTRRVTPDGQDPPRSVCRGK